MRRRALLATASGALLSGCSELSGFTSASDPTATPTPTETPIPLPYRGDDPEKRVEPRGFELRNGTERAQYVTVAVDHGGRTLFVDNFSIGPGATRRFEELVARVGVYRVTVQTASGDRAVHGWVVAPERASDAPLGIFLTEDGVETHQRIYCEPACPPLSTGGEAVELPLQREDDPRPTLAGVLLTNGGERTRSVRLSVELAGRTILNYGYEVPPGVTAAIPVTRAPGAYSVRFEVDGTKRTGTWHVPEESTLTLDVSSIDSLSCRNPQIDWGGSPDRRNETVLRIVNDDTVSHEGTLTATADGRTLVEESFEIEASISILGLSASVPESADTFEVEVALSNGERGVGTWSICRPPEIVTATIGPDADVSVY
jgi:hypothetical protein